MTVYNYEFVKVEQLGDFVVHVALNRPKQVNALHDQIWFEIGDVFDRLDTDDQCRAIILTGEGKGFCSGIDLKGGLQNLITLEEGEDIARKSRTIRRKILKMQDAFTRIEQCCKPVIAAVHGVCLGAGIGIISACDIRYCSKDVDFSVKEVDIGLAADVGSLNRLPKIIGNDSWLREVSLTARHFGSGEAQRYDLVSGIFESKEKMWEEATKIAKTMALKSPVAVQGTKVVLNYSRDHTIAEGLDFVATWNASQLLTEVIPARNEMSKYTVMANNAQNVVDEVQAQLAGVNLHEGGALNERNGEERNNDNLRELVAVNPEQQEQADEDVVHEYAVQRNDNVLVEGVAGPQAVAEAVVNPMTVFNADNLGIRSTGTYLLLDMIDIPAGTVPRWNTGVLRLLFQDRNGSFAEFSCDNDETINFFKKQPRFSYVTMNDFLWENHGYSLQYTVTILAKIARIKNIDVIVQPSMGDKQLQERLSQWQTKEETKNSIGRMVLRLEGIANTNCTNDLYFLTRDDNQIIIKDFDNFGDNIDDMVTKQIYVINNALPATGQVGFDFRVKEATTFEQLN